MYVVCVYSYSLLTTLNQIKNLLDENVCLLDTHFMLQHNDYMCQSAQLQPVDTSIGN